MAWHLLDGVPDAARPVLHARPAGQRQQRRVQLRLGLVAGPEGRHQPKHLRQLLGAQRLRRGAGAEEGDDDGVVGEHLMTPHVAVHLLTGAQMVRGAPLSPRLQLLPRSQHAGSRTTLYALFLHARDCRWSDGA